MTWGATEWAALAGCSTTLAAWFGIKNWQRQLAGQAADKCVAAAKNLEGAYGRYVSVAKLKTSYVAYDQLWQAWRQLSMEYAVARRHYPDLNKDVPDALEDRLRQIKAPGDGSVTEADIEAMRAIEAEIKQYTRAAVAHLGG